MMLMTNHLSSQFLFLKFTKKKKKDGFFGRFALITYKHSTIHYAFEQVSLLFDFLVHNLIFSGFKFVQLLCLESRLVDLL